MKLTILILLSCFQVNANVYSQKVSLTEKNAPLAVIFQKIEQQTGYSFLYNSSWLAETKAVTIDLRDAPLTTALDICFRDQPLTYVIFDKIISLKQKVSNTPIFKMLDTNIGSRIDLKGQVLNEKQESLEKASVEIRGKKRGTYTDAKGMFEFKQVDANGTLIISYSGYATKEIKIEGRAFLNVSLSQSNNALDAIQVVAYGTTTQRLSTGNMSMVKGEDIEKQPVSNPLLALEGRVPGLFITQANGISGSGITVRIQGQNSIVNGNDPFYVIDGVPYVSQLLSTTSGYILGASGGISGSGYGNPLSYINPIDIESIMVLKDADATSIYGSRAANGAILITTKKGKVGPTKVDINLQQGVGVVTREIKLLNTQQYLQMRKEALKNDGLTPDPASDYDITIWDSARYTDWQKILIGGIAQYTNINASVSGGSVNTQYLIGSTYHRETTVFPGDFADQKGSLHFSISNVSIDKKFHIELSGNYMVDNNELPQSDQTYTAISLAPNSPALYNANGSLNWAPTISGQSSFRNPLGYMYNSYQNKTSNLISNMILEYNVLPGLDIKSNFGYTNLETNEFFGNPLIAQRPENRPYSLRSATYSNSTINSWIIEPQIQYMKTHRKSKLDALIGTTIQQTNSNGQNLSGIGYVSDDELSDIHSAASISVNNTNASVYKYNALFGRINYNYDDKYIVNFTARRDGSSRFGAQNQFHNFGSIGGAWIYSREEFIKGNLSFISFGKLRCSIGTTGNDQIGDYQFMSLYNSYVAPVPYQNTIGLSPIGLSNPYLQWEETKKLQFGTDIGFAQDRIFLTTNYVHNRSSNELLQYALPFITGFGAVSDNFPATVQNTAWEFSLTTTNIKSKKFMWNTSINLTIPKNKLIAFPSLTSSTYSQSLVIGQPISVLHVFHFEGVDEATGVYKFAAKSDPLNPTKPGDAIVLINTNPKFYGGFQNSFSYKGFKFDILFQFVKQIGQNNLFNNNPVPGQFNVGYSNQPITVLNRWQTPGDNSAIQRYNSDGSLYSAESYAQSSDAAYSDASYIRLKNLSLSYTLPQKWTQKARLQNVVVYVQGQNLLTITHYQGMDPETLSSSTLPPLKVLTAGLRIEL